MKVRNILLSLAVLGALNIYAADNTAADGKGTVTVNSSAEADADIASIKSIDELAQKMLQVKQQYRYKYMNAIKAKISKLNAKQREEKIAQVEAKLEEKREQMQENVEKMAEKGMSKSMGANENHGFGAMGSEEGGFGGMDGMGGMDSSGMGGMGSGGMGGSGAGGGAGGVGGGSGGGAGGGHF